MDGRERTYYIGNYQRYRARIRELQLDPLTSVYIDNPDRLRGLNRDLNIINLGPVESTREVVKELIAMGYKVQV